MTSNALRRAARAIPAALALLAAPLAAQAPAAGALDARVDSLLARMTLEEKVGQMTQVTLQVVARTAERAGARLELDSAKLEEAVVRRHVGAILNVYDQAVTPETWRTVIETIERFARRARVPVPVLYGVDAVHGNNYQLGSTIFPHNVAMAATWNPALVRREHEITAYETRASGVAWNFAPVLDLGRQPLWPRFYETYGEDPYLASVLGAQAVLGNQRDPRPAIDALLGRRARRTVPFNGPVFVAASAKHYLGYSFPLSGKDRTTAWIPDRELREYFLPSFRAAIDAGIRTVMVNSSDINGIPVHASHEILTDLLRTELGFTGITDSDWEDIVRLHTVHRVAASRKEAVRMAVMAGIDMSMVPYDFAFTDDLLALVREGAVPQARIDEATRRILRVKLELGLFDWVVADPVAMADIGAAPFQAVSRQAAEEAVTLLKNDGVLPLKPGARVLVAGPAANDVRAIHGGWSWTWQGADTLLYPKSAHTLLAALRAQLGEARVSYVPGATYSAEQDVAGAVAAARQADVVVLALGESSYAETPGNIDELALPAAQFRLARALEATGKPVVLVLFHGRPRIVRDAVDSARAVVTGYETGPFGGDAVARVLTGEVNPSGRLPFSWPRFPNALLVPYDRARPADIGGTDSATTGYDPEWAFGHGLSYTTFAYSDLALGSATAGQGDTVTVSVTVTNTGARAGKEVVQLYVRDLFASVTPPMRRLRAFEKVSLAPGERRTVTLRLPVSRLAFVGRDDRLVVEPGDFDVMVGGLTARLTVR